MASSSTILSRQEVVDEPPGGASSIAAPGRIAVGLGRRHSLSLNGLWRFQADPQELGLAERWYADGLADTRPVTVPLPWQLADAELRDYVGVAWYERVFDLPPAFAGQRIALSFLGVDHTAHIWVNGVYAGGHVEAQTPFVLDISSLARNEGENRLTVRVADPPGGTSYFMDTHSLVNVSGIWRDVVLEATGRSFVADLFIEPDVDQQRALAHVTIFWSPDQPSGNLALELIATDEAGRTFRTSGLVASPTTFDEPFVTVSLPIPIADAILWSPNHPHLYGVEAILSSPADGQIDWASVEFGMRKLSTRDGRIYLNDQVIYLIGGALDPGPFGGAVDVNWHQPPPYTYPDDAEIQRDLQRARAVGVNFVRIALRPAPPRLLYWADRLGMLVMQGGPWTPTAGISTAEDLAVYRDCWSAIVLRDRNHPSLMLWELFNESFGIGTEAFRAVATGLYDHVKRLDPTRLILDNAGGSFLNELNYANNHSKTDIEDVHSYPGFATFFAEGGEPRYPATSRELWLSIRWQQAPALVTEFAPAPYIYNIAKIRERWDGKEPWWFNARQVRSVMPAQWDLIGYEERYQRWGFDTIYGDFYAFTAASDWYYFWGLKHQTQLMRMNPELSGFVAWLYDSAPHPVGSIDFFKEFKCYCDELAKLWTPDLVIIDERRRNYWEGERLYADVHVSHFSGHELRGGRVEWHLAGTPTSGMLHSITLGNGEARQVGEIRLEVPAVEQATVMRLVARLVAANGRVLSENYELIQVFPRRNRTPPHRKIAAVGLPANRFEVLGYEVVPLAARPPVALVAHTALDAPIHSFTDEGGAAIVLVCEQPDYWQRLPTPAVSPIEPLLRRNALALGGKFQGGHSDSFFARKQIGIFDRIPYENPLIWPFHKVWPQSVITGVRPTQRDDVLAGAYGNLLRSVPRDSDGSQHWEEVSATLLQLRSGRGRVLISTFNLLMPLLDDPVAAVMLHDLVVYAGGSVVPTGELRLD